MITNYLRLYCIIVGLSFIFSGFILADTTDNEAIGKISTNILTIINGNQATLDSIRSIDVIINKVGTYSFGVKGNRTLEEKIRIWDDKSHIRKDQLESRFVGVEKTHLLLEENNGGKAYFAPPPAKDVEIRSVEAKTNYYSDTSKVFIRPPEWRDSDRASMNDMLKYQTVLGETLKQNIILSARNGYYFDTKNESVDGDDCVLLSCYYPEQKVTLKIWVVPSKGYCIKKMQLLSMGKVYDEYATTLKEYAPGLWWFDTVKANYQDLHKDGHGVTIELSVESIKLNEAINPKMFTIVGTNIPYGTKVIDKITGLKYVYGMAFQLPDEDIDLALDAVAKSTGKEIESSANQTVLENDRLVSQYKPDSTTQVANRLGNSALTQSENLSKPWNRKHGLLIGIAIGLIITVSGFLFVASKKHAKIN
jgi:hypothetical protein